MNISAIVIQVLPENLENVIELLKNSNLCEYHLHDTIGKIIVTIEAEDVSEEIQKLKQIQELPHVIAADMVYAYADEEINKERAKLLTQNIVPEWLNDNNIQAQDIKYSGNIR